MAEVKSIYQGQPVRKKDGTLSGPMYFTVNASGAVHRVGRDKALELLKDARYRLAEDAEIERFYDNKIQSHKAPFGTKWDPTPDILVNIPDPIVIKEKKIPATAGARELAVEHEVDLAGVTPTGAGGQVIKKDVQRYLDGDDEDEAPVDPPEDPPADKEDEADPPETQDGPETSEE